MVRCKNSIKLVCLVVLCVLFTFELNSHAADRNCLGNNKNAYWEYDKASETLIISGKGAADISDIDISEKKVKKLVVKKGITYISGAKKFEYLTSVKLSSSVNTIGKKAFDNCKNLKKVTGLKYVKVIGAKAFCGCTGLKQVEFGNSLIRIEAYAFWQSGLESLELPDSVKTMKTQAFAETPLTTVKLPANLEVIEEKLFMNCHKLKSVKMPKKVRVIKYNAFGNCSELRITKLPNSIETICNYSFSGCEKIEKIILPKNLEEIERYAFEGCTNIKSIVIQSEDMTKKGIVGALYFYVDYPVHEIKVPKTVSKKYTRWLKAYYDRVYGELSREGLEGFPYKMPHKIVAY